MDADPLKNAVFKYHHKVIHFQLLDNESGGTGPVSPFYNANVGGPR